VQQHEAQVISEFFKKLSIPTLWEKKKTRIKEPFGPGYFTPLNEPMVFMKESNNEQLQLVAGYLKF
jgi:hypothetical protein